MSDALVIRLILGIAYLFEGAVLALFAVPLMRSRIRRNSWYGFRDAKALASDENWFAINRYGGRLLLRTGVALMLIGTGMPLAPLPHRAWVYLILTVGTGVALIPVMVGVSRFAQKR